MKRFLMLFNFILFVFLGITNCAANEKSIADIKVEMRTELATQYITNKELIQNSLELQIDLAAIAILGRFPTTEDESIDIDQFATEAELEGIMGQEIQYLSAAAGTFGYVPISTFVDSNYVKDLREKISYLDTKFIGGESLTQRFLRATGFASKEGFLSFVQEQLQKKLCVRFGPEIRKEYPMMSKGKRDEDLGVMQSILLAASFPMAKDILQERRIELSRPKTVITTRALPPTNPKLTQLKDALTRLQGRLQELNTKLGRLKNKRH